eukprot:jgi/Galph1/5645/GphlegSOOS_G4297.1
MEDTVLKAFELSIKFDKISGLIVPQARNVRVEWVDEKVNGSLMGLESSAADSGFFVSLGNSGNYWVQKSGKRWHSGVSGHNIIQQNSVTRECEHSKVLLNIRGSERIRKLYALHRRSEFENVTPLVEYDPSLVAKLKLQSQSPVSTEDGSTTTEELNSSSSEKTSKEYSQATPSGHTTAWPTAILGANDDPEFIIGRAELDAAVFLEDEVDPEQRTPCQKRLEISVLNDSGIRVATIYMNTTAKFIPDTSFSCRDLFSMVPNGEWLLRVLVHEVRDVLSMDRKGGTTDPYIKISTFGQTMRTQRVLNSVNAVFRRILYFCASLNGWELEREALSVQLYDWNRVRKDVLIGVHEMDLKYIYDQPDHRLKEKWFPLYSSYGSRVEKVLNRAMDLSTVGYVKLSLTLIPPFSKSVQRKDYYEFEERSGRQLLNNLVLRRPPLVPEPWNLYVCIYRAEMLPRMALKGMKDIIRAYGRCCYGGYENICTSTKQSLKSLEKAGFALSAAMVKNFQKQITKKASSVIRNATFTSGKKNNTMITGLFPSRGRWVEWDEMIRVPVSVVNGQVSQDLIKLEFCHQRDSFLGMQSLEKSDLIGSLQFRFSDILAHRERVKIHYLKPEPDKDSGEDLKKSIQYLLEKEKKEADTPHFYERLLSVENKINRFLFGEDSLKDASSENEFTERVYQMEPRWYNFYGPARGPTDYGKKGAAYRGRVLVSLHAARSLGPLAPARIRIPSELCVEPDTSRYQLDYSIYQLCEVPLPATSVLVSFDVQIGTFAFGGDIPAQPVQSRSVKWENGFGVHGSFGDLELPARFGDIPDIFVNLYAQPKKREIEKKTRFAYLRISAKYIRQCIKYPRWFLMDNAGSNFVSFYDIPGNILLSLSLTPSEEYSTSTSSSREALERSQFNVFRSPSVARANFVLRCYMIQGRNIPAVGDEDLANPYFVVHCGENSARSQTICKETLFPQWFECVSLEIPTLGVDFLPDIFILVCEQYKGKKKSSASDSIESHADICLGRAIISREQVRLVEPTFPMGRWYPLFHINPEVPMGEVLADFHLLPKELENSLPVINLEPERFRIWLRISLVGVLDLAYQNRSIKEISAYLRIQNGNHTEHGQTSFYSVTPCLNQKSCDGFLREVFHIPLDLPAKDVVLAPTVQMRMQLLAVAIWHWDDYLAVFLHRKRHSSNTPDNLVDKFVHSSYYQELSCKYAMKEIDEETASWIVELISDESCGTEFDNILKDLKKEVGRSQRRWDSVPRGHFLSVSHPQYHVLRMGSGREPFKDIVEESVVVGGSEDGRHRARLIRQCITIFELSLEGLRVLAAFLKDLIVEYVPDLALRVGIQEEELPSFFYPESSQLQEVGNLGSTIHCRARRGFSPVELEEDFCHARYAELFLSRGYLNHLFYEEFKRSTEEYFEDSILTKEQKKALSKISSGTQGVIASTVKGLKEPKSAANHMKASGKSLLHWNEQHESGKDMTSILGRLKLEAEILDGDNSTAEGAKGRENYISRWRNIYQEQPVVVRLYILHGWNLRSAEGYSNSYLKVSCSFSDGKTYCTKSHPVSGTLHPKFFETFELKCIMPYSSLRIKVKNHRAPELDIPLAGGFGLNRSWNIGVLAHKRLAYSVSVDTKRIPGLRKSKLIGETYVDLAHRWYNPAWRLLVQKPVEMRSLWSPDSTTPTGRLECFIDILSEEEAKHVGSEDIMPEPPKNFEVRLVVWGVQGCFMPVTREQETANQFPTPDICVAGEFGLDRSTLLHTDIHPKSDDGCGEFNYRMIWNTRFPEESSYRVRLMIWDVSSSPTGTVTDGTFIAECQLNLEPLLKEAFVTGSVVSRKPQWLKFSHPNYTQLNAHAKISVDVLDASNAKLYPVGNGRREPNQYPYLPPPFRPVFLNPLNPMPFVWYQIYKYIYYYFWSVVSYLSMTPLVLLGVKVVAWLPFWVFLLASLLGIFIYLRLGKFEETERPVVQENEEKER